MPITSSDLSELILPGLRAEFALAMRSELEQDPVASIATVINTTQPIQRYGLIDPSPAMREFIDERRATGLSTDSFQIADKVFESTIAVDRKAMEDDQLDLIRLRIRDLAGRVAQHRQQLVVQQLLDTELSSGYDGEPLLSESHLYGSSNVSNRNDAELSTNTLKFASVEMMKWSDREGIPLGIMPDTLLVGPSQMWNALELVESPGASQVESSPGTINVFQGRLKVVVTPYLTGNQWFLMDTKRAIRPVILQQRSDVPVEFTALDQSVSSESAFLRDRFMYGVRGRYNVGPGLWQTVYGSLEA